MPARGVFAAVLSFLIAQLLPLAASAKVNVAVVHNSPATATSQFNLRLIPAPIADDAAAKAKISVVAGRRDRNGGDVEKLIDGQRPTDADQPSENFLFDSGTAGGRLVFDLGQPAKIDQVNTYSWHPQGRGPQVYKLYGSVGAGDSFSAEPQENADLQEAGWTLVAEVDTRPTGNSEEGGQYGVSIFDSEGPLGPYRYLLFDILRTDNEDQFGNTFYSEIDVIASSTTAAEEAASPRRHVVTIESEGTSYKATFDTTEAPDLTDWVKNELAPVVEQWYPKIVKMLPSEDYEAPREFTIRFTPEYRGVAAASGSRVVCSPDWFRRNLEGEAKGAVVHELVHVVQQYGRARRRNPEARRSPGWLVEGVADYIRWFLYEPESRGAEITDRNFERARCDGSYRITANFLNWVTQEHDPEVVRKLNAAMRDGRYDEDLWVDYTKKTLEELGNEWRAKLARDLGRPVEVKKEADEDDEQAATEDNNDETALNDSEHNTLTAAEQAAGWMLLFDGNSLDNWHTFRMEGVRPGWQVKDGAIVCANPRNAGDLCTDDQFGWFELKFEYNISEGGNSGIIFHVSDEGRATWATGPELQLEDNAHAQDPVRSGWLYALYQLPDDPKTGKPLDATKPAGEWNQVRLLVSPEKCLHEMNGTKYVEYVLDSDDFKNRVAKSKFGRMRRFARTHKGYIALQGDHGEVSFRNIKVRPISTETAAE